MSKSVPPPAHIDYDRSTPRCENCQHFKHMQHSPEKEHFVCGQFNFLIRRVGLCDEWVSTTGEKLK